MSSELFNAAERTFGLAGLKAKDVPQVLDTLKKEFNVDATSSGDMLSLRQGDTELNIPAAMKNYQAKHPRDFYGNPADITFKEDVADDTSAKVEFIKQHGYQAWAALPLNEKSLRAQNAVRNAIPSSHMTRQQYLLLKVAEKTKLASEIGPAGIGRIMNRR